MHNLLPFSDISRIRRTPTVHFFGLRHQKRHRYIQPARWPAALLANHKVRTLQRAMKKAILNITDSDDIH